jgi:phage virion morphogenesis protein
MAGVTINVTIKDNDVKRLLSNLQQRMRSLRPVMSLIGEIVVESVQRNFEQHRSPGGQAWKPLSSSYAQWKSGVKGRSTADILILNRIHMGSIHHKASDDRVSVGTRASTNVVYAAIHRFGGKTGPHVIKPVSRKALSWPGAGHPVKSVKHPGSDIPARPFLGVRTEDWTSIRNAVENYLLRR